MAAFLRIRLKSRNPGLILDRTEDGLLFEEQNPDWIVYAQQKFDTRC